MRSTIVRWCQAFQDCPPKFLSSLRRHPIGIPSTVIDPDKKSPDSQLITQKNQNSKKSLAKYSDWPLSYFLLSLSLSSQ